MLLYSKVKNKKTKEYEVINQVEAKSLGWKQNELEVGFDGKFYLEGHAPVQQFTAEEIEEMRRHRFKTEADPILGQYQEALVRGAENANELKQRWLAKKDEIRADLPYPEGES